MHAGIMHAYCCSISDRPRVIVSSVHLLVISVPWLLPLGHLLMGHDDWSF